MRAIMTINLYKLNDFGRDDDRIQEYQRFIDSKTQIIDDFSYQICFS